MKGLFGGLQPCGLTAEKASGELCVVPEAETPTPPSQLPENNGKISKGGSGPPVWQGELGVIGIGAYM